MEEKDLIDNLQKLPREEQSPILGSWKNVYLLVMIVLIAVIAGLWILTKTFR